MHSFRFYRAGGVDQVRLDSGADIANLKHLDQKLWLALTCPVKGLEVDEKTLALIDTDQDGRVRVPELLAAIDFCAAALCDLEPLVRGGDSLELASLDPAKPAGAAMLASATETLHNLGKADAKAVTLADVTNTAHLMAQALFNGDGVVCEKAVAGEGGKGLLRDILATVGGVKDVGGGDGVSQADVERFFAEAKSVSEWHAAAEAKGAAMLPAGDDTAAAHTAVEALKAKADDFFARCRVAAYDPRAAAAAHGQEAELAAILAKGLSADAAEVAAFPLARVAPGAALPLSGTVNPAWAAKVSALRDAAVVPLLGARETLDEAGWQEIKARLAAYAAHHGAKPATQVDALGIERLRALLAGPERAELEAAIFEDKKHEAAFKGMADLERLIRCQRDLFRLLNNFVSFSDFYDPRIEATFQAGHLFLDNRECELCIPVADAGKHGAMASQSRCCLAYCDLTRKGEAGPEKMQVVAVFSNGDSDFLTVGRNGLFYDRKGRDWDATITKVVDNPISIRQAFWSPYKKFLKLVEELITKRAAAADEAANARVAAAASATAGTAPPPPPKKFDPAVVAMVGVAIGGISTALSAGLAVFLGLGKWIPLAVLGIVLVISGPSMILAWFKLRQRNIGPVLEANGWAINSRARVNPVFGATLTRLPEFPAGCTRSTSDPFAQKPSLAARVVQVALPLAVVVGAVVGLYHLGFLPQFAEDRLHVLRVPHYLKVERDLAIKARDEAVAAQNEVQAKVVDPAQKAWNDLKAKGHDADPGDLKEAAVNLRDAKGMLRDAQKETAAARRRYTEARDALNKARGAEAIPDEEPPAAPPAAAPAPAAAP